ncbi:MAG: NAD-dependent epimerase/dehydratase family protein [Pseudomonadota bacterium]
MAETVLLTGITGFIAKRIAKDLLDAGYKVRGSLRSPTREAEVRAALNEPGTERLTFVTLDLSADDGWAEAMDGVSAVLHTASPFPLSNPKDENEVIRPAVDGTLRALRAAQAAGITRIVLTSSVVAIMYSGKPVGSGYGPDDWTDVNHPAARPYVKSKTLAERVAWDFGAEHPEMQLTVINPGLVTGTPLDPNYGASLELVERVLKGGDPAIPDVGFPVVDVADVSKLHVDALTKPESIGKRVIAAGEFWTLPKMATLLKENYPNRKISDRVAPKWLLRIIALFDPAVRTILPEVGTKMPTDNSETRAMFGINFVPGRDAILASAEAIIAKNG